MKKLVIIATGWHFPLHFYRRIKEQNVPKGWEIDYICISHRNPEHSIEEKQDLGGKTFLHDIDKILYKEIATEEKLKKIEWKYSLEPNTIGDWECANQWIDKNNNDFDVMLISHDDNFIIGNTLFEDILLSKINNLYSNKWQSGGVYRTKYNDNWLVISNSFIIGKPHLRGSFDFFKKEIINMMGGKFDLSNVKLNRVGKYNSPRNHLSLGDWNATVYNMISFMKKNNLFNRVWFLSDKYRVSNYCIEGERGLISHRNVLGEEYIVNVKDLWERKMIRNEYPE